MRSSAVVPLVLSIAAFILSMLCLFAGSKQGFMEDYAIVTLNTSQIGRNVFNDSESTSSGNPVTNWIHNITNSIESELNDDIGTFARDLGLHDWYSAHILDYCEGYFTPAAVPNATVTKSDIDKNITHCSNRTAFFHFDPSKTLQTELDNSGVGINLTSLDWPDAINDGIKTARVAQKAVFILYCLAAGLLLICALAALVGIFLTGRLTACVNMLLCTLAFFAILIASALATTVAVKVANVVNQHGKDIGVSASKGGRFMALTWVATVLALLDCAVWAVECCVGRRRKTYAKAQYGEFGGVERK
ncbi:hypothetical protein AAFC00_002882 [Neodothiora populina]|uniref:SUR7 protein n=1 Tax=Neodothiora populina TaxID=2781224 RepID=A0ABR3P8J5_9PEZI